MTPIAGTMSFGCGVFSSRYPDNVMSTRKQGVWLFGAAPDLLLGAGLLYLMVASGLFAWGTGAQEAIPPSWIAYLVLFVSGSHYGGTLLRVYEHGAERRAYRIFVLYGTVLMLIVLIGALYSPIAGSLLITLYLTWSPWHYTGQNYGIAVMFLRRRGVEVTPAAKRWLHASFILSYLSVLLTMHFEGGIGQSDPLGYRSLDIEKFQFISMGLPGELSALLMPVVGLGYVASIIAAGTLLVRAAGVRAVAPAALLMLTQAAWFSIPYFGSHFGLPAGIPGLNPTDSDNYSFYFIWVALGHAAQYLWITAYYARANRRWRGYGRYFVKVFVFGNAAWAAPVMLLGPEALGRPDFNFGLAMCVASAVNLHHFMLDGAIWKLRNPRLAAILLRGRAAEEEEPRTHDTGSWRRRIAWTLAGLFCLAKVVSYADLVQRFPNALRRNDFATAESILDRAAVYGRDSSVLRVRLAKRLGETQTPLKSLPQFWRSLRLHPHAAGFVELGVVSQRLQGVEQAILIWEQGLALFPGDFDLNRHLGASFLTRRRPRAALPYLERAVEIQPSNERARADLAEARLLMRPRDGAG